MKFVEMDGLLETDGGLLANDDDYANAAMDAVNASANAAKERRDHGKDMALKNHDKHMADIAKPDVFG